MHVAARAGLGALAALAGCGGGARNSLSGSLHGQPARAADSASEIVSVPSAQGPIRLAAVVLSSAAGLCASVQAGRHAASASLLVLYLGELDVSTAQPGPPASTGAYAVVATLPAPTSRFALVRALSTDASCAPLGSLTELGVGGTVQLTRIGAGFAGTLSIDLQPADSTGASADHLAGSFDAASCAGVGGYALEAIPSSCH